ncbi:MAG: YebC/PmpR family DNA-binding transcriptional regulator [SAR324 cluster bacterium]|nr:YebC/PmpR family DNA-binding transcriptional regulator [SAR324 cluster bacterium]MBF0353197.1 YebC/PmpR family DNA-binding transcriptional regulator [SAR324 cluster bacterium]
MSGHNKWSTIKHRKAAQDSKKGKVFTKLIKELTIAARIGGGDAQSNPRLRSAIATARANSMPKENIDRAIKKGTGDLDGADYEEIIYEGYAPGNVAVIVEAMTDNRNRTSSSVRFAFTRSGGNLGATNSVQYMFDRRGIIQVAKTVMSEDELMELALEAGASDMNSDNLETYEIITETSDFNDVQQALENKGIQMLEAEIAWVPQNRVIVDDVKKAEQIMKLIDALEDDDDIQKVHSNFDISEDVLRQLS